MEDKKSEVGGQKSEDAGVDCEVVGHTMMNTNSFAGCGAILGIMHHNPETSDPLFREQVLRARSMDPAEKLSAGFELFEYACEITRAGIRSQHPQADEMEVERILAERLALGKQLEVGQWKSRRYKGSE